LIPAGSVFLLASQTVWELNQGLKGFMVFGCASGTGRLEQLELGTLGTCGSLKRFERSIAVEPLERLELGYCNFT
jgi:hypothetical protein